MRMLSRISHVSPPPLLQSHPPPECIYRPLRNTIDGAAPSRFNLPGISRLRLAGFLSRRPRIREIRSSARAQHTYRGVISALPKFLQVRAPVCGINSALTLHKLSLSLYLSFLPLALCMFPQSVPTVLCNPLVCYIRSTESRIDNYRVALALRLRFENFGKQASGLKDNCHFQTHFDPVAIFFFHNLRGSTVIVK